MRRSQSLQGHFTDEGTALICAAMKGHAECARLLLDAGADTEVKNKVRARAAGGVRSEADADDGMSCGVEMCHWHFRFQFSQSTFFTS